ncbi:replication restart DNA helicase PriA [Nitrosomonas cryotolerans]|uniref:Replication restart protein PriA n=1 Tax=Nitrosomonas cryotolerans ATCC 49181 TaxID=1131553 RepID=A0A1N6J021_9PROT|nr:primosomal protein N' [Nitrosomonas cryotolerans]SFP54354.1 replication restart DNA helicase PriA [Nitrosomonas cryotolerans]SIO37605.1 replication restart DNA helicase PriA [Nitrosomonas cryotolerans ATCC 49181]
MPATRFSCHMPIIRVALNIPVNTLFDYVASNVNMQDIGLRVRVPFGKKSMTGVIMAIDMNSHMAADKLKAVEYIFRDIPPLPAALLDIFHFCSRYYHHPLGRIVLNGLPGRLRDNKPIKPAVQTTHTLFRLTDIGYAVDIHSIPTRNTVARRLLTQLRESGTINNQDAKQISPRTSKLLKEFIMCGWVETIPAPAETVQPTPTPIPTDEQNNAINTITAEIREFNVWLLQGITGSGKTEVYLRLIAHVLSQEKQTLVLIPEISLTPQLETIFQARFPNTPLVSLHSGLNDTQRAIAWLQAQNGQAKIILGTRLAVFTPLPDMGLIIVDEEQDNSFKQQDRLRYSARDIAIFRARQGNIPIILGSATPSLESYYNAAIGRYRSLRLSSRAVKNAALPIVHCVDIRTNKIKDGLSEPMILALRNTLAQKHQSLIFINRRGYAPVLFCNSCAWIAICQRCTSRLVVHLSERKLYCHHCGYQTPLPQACLQCGNQNIVPFGHGTQRVEAALTAHFPDARILRIDRDSIRRKGTWHAALKAIHAQQVDILIGTQLLAKGHDFPNLSLVGILNPDSALYSTDFRASERLFAQLMQVAGRAGRAAVPGKVLIQTAFPNHPLYHALRQHDYDVLAKMLLSERKQAALPPFVYQALLRAEAHNIHTALAFLTSAAGMVEVSQNIEIFDPVPAPMVRLKGLEHAHLLVQSPSRKKLQAFLAEWYRKLNSISTRSVRWVLDVDPSGF